MEKHAHKLVVQLCTIMFKSEQSVSSATRKLTTAETVLYRAVSFLHLQQHVTRLKLFRTFALFWCMC